MGPWRPGLVGTMKMSRLFPSRAVKWEEKKGMEIHVCWWLKPMWFKVVLCAKVNQKSHLLLIEVKIQITLKCFQQHLAIFTSLL